MQLGCVRVPEEASSRDAGVRVAKKVMVVRVFGNLVPL